MSDINIVIKKSQFGGHRPALMRGDICIFDSQYSFKETVKAREFASLIANQLEWYGSSAAHRAKMQYIRHNRKHLVTGK